MKIELKTYNRSLFLFRRDLRLEDNTGLNAALSRSRETIPAFHLNPEQIDEHPYRSEPGLHFMLLSLRILADRLAEIGSRLSVFHGGMEDILKKWIQELKVEAIWVNRDYTPYSAKRDSAIEAICKNLGADFHSCSDALLLEPESALKKDGSPYTIFTPFYNNARQRPIPKPDNLDVASKSFARESYGEEMEPLFQSIVSSLPPTQASPEPGNRPRAILDNLANLRSYATERDLPALESTSNLSPHLKFGTCSPRQAYWSIARSLGSEHPLIRQLYWRDFLTHIGFHFPHVFGASFKAKYEGIAWENDPSKFDAWKAGNTGFPIVDAGMRQLNATGGMHNRVRMIVASFLTKDLHIDWRWGERYFAQRLVDYDPCVNNGNWQWAASTGCDAQPYFRIFNPWRQQLRFDPEAVYIKRWVSELESAPTKEIHSPKPSLFKGDYPEPIVDHGRASQKARMLFEGL